MGWLLTGAGGQLGSVTLRALARSGESALGLASKDGPFPPEGTCTRVDLTDLHALGALVSGARPRIIVHTAAVSSLTAAHENPTLADAVNREATAMLARMAAEIGARFVFTSTDMVFDGRAAPYDERAAPSPLSAYARSKRAGERETLRWPGALVLRLPLLYGVPASKRETTFLSQVRALREGRRLTLFEDEWRTPLWLEDAANALIRSAESNCSGVLHAGGPERLSRIAMGERLAHALGEGATHLSRASRLDVPSPEPRPADLSFDSRLYHETFGEPPGRTMDEALARMVDEGAFR